MSEDREPAVEHVIESKRIFEGRICALRVDTVRLEDGRTATREIIEHDPVVAAGRVIEGRRGPEVVDPIRLTG